MMKACKCEHWQQCPVCMPHRFDKNGSLLPPEPTPLQAAKLRIEELERERDLHKAKFDAINADFDKLEDERDELKAAIELYEQALMACWPEGAMGDAYEYWNAARAALAKGEKNG